MGRLPQKITKTFESPYSGRVERKLAFTWEKLDLLMKLKTLLNYEFKISN